ncbi:glycosyl hydrolase [Ruminococcus sp.]|uniref:glycosyl hydrolase n=1 Tax=Ruminococcus sp. TaxID=41978 RepID=UPI0025DA435B|nr:glycosyl hydrolase [Ruminococcus sp.]
MREINIVPANSNAQECVKNVMRYLAEICCEKTLTGQHTQTRAQEELHHIKAVTGKEPALLGFELLSYSPNINYTDTDEECMTEVEANYGTLRQAWQWAERGGLVTFTWHWFSPLGGRSKAFFTENTDFDPARAVISGTPENRALISDMDYMAGLLRPFCDKGIPILWRPFHECEGTWFWWGSKGGETVVKLWRLMFERFTKVHGLDDLIWVWNGTKKECYPGDDVVDIISRDMYP